MGSVKNLRRLAEGTTTTERWAQAMDLCARTPGTFLPTSQIGEATGMGVEGWRSAARQITRHLVAHYPDVPPDEHGPHAWPLWAKSRPEHPGEVSWAISPEMADLWREARES